MINLKCIGNFEIGTMGQLMSIFRNIESKIFSLEEIENIVIYNTREIIDANPFEYIFKQNYLINNYTTINLIPVGAYTEDIPSDKLMRYKEIKSKFVLCDEIVNRFNNIKKDLSINDAFLGAHVRLTDMNAWHGNVYGYTYLEDFIETIDMAMKTNEYTKVFVASDSQESILKLKKIYGETMVCYNDFIRLESEVGDLVGFIKKNLPTNKKWIQDSFIEMLLLSECGGLIHRVTNFANVTKIYSNTIKKTFFISGKHKTHGRVSGDWIISVENGEVKARKRYRNE